MKFLLLTWTACALAFAPVHGEKAAVGIGGELQLLWDDEIVDTARTDGRRDLRPVRRGHLFV